MKKRFLFAAPVLWAALLMGSPVFAQAGGGGAGGGGAAGGGAAGGAGANAGAAQVGGAGGAAAQAGAQGAIGPGAQPGPNVGTPGASPQLDGQGVGTGVRGQSGINAGAAQTPGALGGQVGTGVRGQAGTGLSGQTGTNAGAFGADPRDTNANVGADNANIGLDADADARAGVRATGRDAVNADNLGAAGGQVDAQATLGADTDADGNLNAGADASANAPNFTDERSRFQFQNGRWTFRTNDGRMAVLQDNGQWLMDGSVWLDSQGNLSANAEGTTEPPALAGFPDLQPQLHNGLWWARMNNGDWVFFRNGTWFNEDGQTFARGDFRFNDGHWWQFRPGEGWLFVRNGSLFDLDGNVVSRLGPTEIAELGLNNTAQGRFSRSFRGNVNRGQFLNRGTGTMLDRAFRPSVPNVAPNPSGAVNPGGALRGTLNQGGALGAGASGNANIGLTNGLSQ